MARRIPFALPRQYCARPCSGPGGRARARLVGTLGRGSVDEGTSPLRVDRGRPIGGL